MSIGPLLLLHGQFCTMYPKESPQYPDGDLLEGGVAIISLSARPYARLIGMCPAALQSVSSQCKASWNDIKYALTHRAKISKGAKGTRISQHPDHDDLCMAHNGYAGYPSAEG